MANAKDKAAVKNAAQVKFSEMISMTGNALLKNRGQMLTAQTERVFKRALMDAQDKVDTIKCKIADLEDLGVETTDSLKPAKGFDPAKWTNEILKLNMELWQAELALKVVTENYNKYFSLQGEDEDGTVAAE